MDIQWHRRPFPSEAKFSIVIPTWNNLPYLKLCIESILKNSYFTHQILIHVNDGSDGTEMWVKDNGFGYTHTRENAGICIGVNAVAQLAACDYIVYMNDDMYACPGWDLHLWNAIHRIPGDGFLLSATMIEPVETGNQCVLAPGDFGRTPETFLEDALLKWFDKPQFPDWQGSTWPPTVVHRRYWHLAGGLSIEFSPGMYSDPDFAMKLWYLGVRWFQGVGNSRVYHFQAKSTGRIKKNDGKGLFRKKWGIKSSVFTREILRRGEPFRGPLQHPDTHAIPNKHRNWIFKAWQVLTGKS